MEERKAKRCKAYRFILTAVSFGSNEDEALESLIEYLGEPALQAFEEGITFEALDYAYFTREDFIAEA